MAFGKGEERDRHARLVASQIVPPWSINRRRRCRPDVSRDT